MLRSPPGWPPPAASRPNGGRDCRGRLNGHGRGRRTAARPLAAAAGRHVDLDRALDRGQLTLRGYDRVLRLGWTVADLAGHTTPDRGDLGLALTMRNQGPVAA